MQKERFEWIHSWCDNTNDGGPRVLLIGDSITNGYQANVRELLQGRCWVDYIAASYALDNPFYHQLILDFAADSDYAVIHFNHGLHGMHLNADDYEKAMDELTGKLAAMGKVILVTSTFVYKPGPGEPCERHGKIVPERNAALVRIAEKYGLAIDDLYAVTAALPRDHYSQDGTHLAPEGYKALAEQVAASVLAQLA